jgi:cytochrome c oxidase assembly protein Cox11
MTQPARQRDQANKRLAGKLALVVVGMFGFGFAMWPL